MTTLNPFSSEDKQHFPEFSPMFKKKTPSSSEKKTFRWSIDQIAILKPANIDTDDKALAIANEHSPDNEDKQKEIDHYFSKTALPSPWPAAPARSTKKSKGPCPPKRVTFSPLPSDTPFIQERGLVECQARDNRTADAGTQTTLTFPMTLDLEQMLAAMCHAYQWEMGAEQGEEGEATADKDGNSSTLRRKLFGQPERQDSGCSDEEMTSVLPSPPDPLPVTPHSKQPHPHSAGSSPAIILTRPSVPDHTPNKQPYPHSANNSESSEKSGHSPLHSSLVLRTPGGHFALVSPINEGSKECNDIEGGQLSVMKMSPIGQAVEPQGERLEKAPHLVVVSPVNGDTKVAAACTSTPNNASMKRQLAPSPFASPVLKHPCTVRDDEATPPAATLEESRAMPCRSLIGVGSLAEVTEDSKQAQPLCLADLCTQTSDLTGITSTTCTGFFNEMCLEDSITGIGSTNGHRLHPLHSTAHVAHLGSTRLANWHETPVPFANRNGNWTQPQISGVSQIHGSMSGTTSNPYSGLDSGVGGSTELSNPSSGTDEEAGRAVRNNPALSSPMPTIHEGVAITQAGQKGVPSNTPIGGVVCSTDSTHNAGQVPAEKGVVFNSPLMTPSHNRTSEGHLEVGQRPPDGDSGLVLPAADFSPINNAHQTRNTDSAGTLHSAANCEALSLATPSSVMATLTAAGNCPLAPSQVDILSSSWKLHHPSVHPYATAVTTSASQRRSQGSPVTGVSHLPDSADTTPRRYSGGTGPVGAGAAFKRHALASLPPLFSNELLQRKELIKSRLQFKSPSKLDLSPCSLDYLRKLRTPLSPHNHFHPPSLPLYNKTCVLSPLTPTSSPVSPWRQSPSPSACTSGGKKHKENFRSAPVTPSSHRTRLKALHRF